MVSCSLSPNSRPLLVHHVALRLGVSCRTVRWWAETDRLPGRRANIKIWLFDPIDVEMFAVRRQRKAA
jgi:hypothetical protein